MSSPSASSSIWVQETPSRGKRPLPPSSQASPSNKRAAIPSFRWSVDRTNELFGWFVEYFNEGLFKPKQGKATVFKLAAERALETWGKHTNITPTKIQAKYDNEKKRYLVWKSWISRSGVTHDEQGRVEVDPNNEAWIEFSRYITPSAVKWISDGKPLGPVAEMHHIWAKDWAKGAWLEKPPVALTAAFRRYDYHFESESEDHSGGDSTGEDEGGNEVESTADGDSFIDLSLFSGQPTQRETPAARLRRETDPDITPLPDLGEDLAVIEPNRHRKKKEGSRRHPNNASAILQEIQQTLKTAIT
ncbi:hypothetical protein MCOR02_005040 [Pyricularia oryzae]|nr:hypothetical protein MCOR02_005040 [Pyricularia oryzae]